MRDKRSPQSNQLGVETEFSITLVNGIIESMEELINNLIEQGVKNFPGYRQPHLN